MYLQATGITALSRLHTGACAMLFPACTFAPSIWKYSDSTCISAGRAAASGENGRVGAERAVAHSADRTHIEEIMVEFVDGENILKDIGKVDGRKSGGQREERRDQAGPKVLDAPGI